ncbi:hypothetical protein [Baia soyae]|uniref:Uncharacterized protein n=1 Tax=Baia soyae TaxID=1544746 RepID=A0A4R2S7J4_9BACL|nr:hypothetical protein [Baia soyae]TCP68371.1 hypothetical protein EDD57_11759 [Baia soyae]
MTMRWIGVKISAVLALCTVFITNMSKQTTELKQLYFWGVWGAFALLVLLAYRQEWQRLSKKMKIQKEYRQRLEWMHKEREYDQEKKRVQRSFYT